MCTLETVLAGPVDRESYSSTFEIATVDIQQELIHVKIEIAPPPPEVPNIQQSNFRLGISHASKF
jgi:hypothetical protein